MIESIAKIIPQPNIRILSISSQENANEGQKGGTLVYEKVKKLADERKISIYALERKAGLKNGAISKWRESSPTLNSLQAVAEALETTIDNLLKEE